MDNINLNNAVNFTNKNNQNNYLNVLNCYPNTNIDGEKIEVLNVANQSESRQNEKIQNNLIDQSSNALHNDNNKQNNLLNMFQSISNNNQNFNPLNLLQGLSQNNNMLETILNLIGNFKSDNNKNSANLLTNLFNFTKKEEKVSKLQKDSSSQIDKFVKIEDVDL